MSDDLMDLHGHLRAEIIRHFVMSGVQLDASPNTNWKVAVAGLADGIVNYLNQRETHRSRTLADWPAELLERASLMLMIAAIEAAKRESGQ